MTGEITLITSEEDLPLCPRCGRNRYIEWGSTDVADELYHRVKPAATLRAARPIPIFVCSACGTDEAVRQHAGLPEIDYLTEWPYPGRLLDWDDISHAAGLEIRPDEGS